MFLRTLRILFGILVCPDVTARACGSLNITGQCKMRVLDINMHFINRNIHVLCNMKSYERHLMKIIKG